MAGDAVASAGRLPRPALLKGLHHVQLKRNLFISIGLSIVGAIAFKLAVSDPRKAAYAEFYKSYDVDASFERMRKAGIFVSAPADD